MQATRRRGGSGGKEAEVRGFVTSGKNAHTRKTTETNFCVLGLKPPGMGALVG